MDNLLKVITWFCFIVAIIDLLLILGVLFRPEIEDRPCILQELEGYSRFFDVECHKLSISESANWSSDVLSNVIKSIDGSKVEGQIYKINDLYCDTKFICVYNIGAKEVIGVKSSLKISLKRANSNLTIIINGTN